MPSADRSARRRVPAAVALALGGGLLAAPAVPAQAADTPQPAAHYTFDQDDLASGKITDSSGNGLTATLVNGSTAQSVTGTDGGRALALPGGAPTSDGAYVRLPREVLGAATDLTVSARVKWSDDKSSWQRIFDLGTDTTRYLFTTPSNGNGLLRTAVTTGGGGAEAQVLRLRAPARRRVGGPSPSPSTPPPTGSPPTSTAWRSPPPRRPSRPRTCWTVRPRPPATSASPSTRTRCSRARSTTSRSGTRRSAPSRWPARSGTCPTLQQLSRTSFEVRTTAGTAPSLPAAVRASFSDGYDRDTPVTWDDVPPEKYARPGTFEVAGTAAGRTVKATVTVVREGQLTVDLGSDTGAFHGGASGTLYGVYGPGVPTNNLIEGMGLRTVSTKAQDGPQHPGADALEVVKPLADSTDGDVYIYMTDIHRGFPYEWPGDTPAGEAQALRGEDRQAGRPGSAAAEAVPGQHRLRAVQRARGQHVRHRRVELRQGQLAQRPRRLLRRLGRGLQAHQGQDAGRPHRRPQHQRPVRPGEGLPHAHPGRRHPPGRDHLARAEPPGGGARERRQVPGVGEGVVQGHRPRGHPTARQHQRVRLQLPHLRPRPDDPVGLRDRGVQGGRRHRVLEHRRQPLRLRRAVQPRQRPVVAAQLVRLDERPHGGR